MRVNNTLRIFLWVLAFETVSGFLGRVAMTDVMTWYAQLQRPPLAPPNWAFPVAWTILYALIAGAGWRIWSMPAGRERKILLASYAAYLALNWSWSFIFFGLHLMLLGFIWIMVMNVIALVIILRGWKTEKMAAWLMIPPLVWTSFAAYLDGAYWWLNR